MTSGETRRRGPILRRGRIDQGLVSSGFQVIGAIEFKTKVPYQGHDPCLGWLGFDRLEMTVEDGYHVHRHSGIET